MAMHHPSRDPLAVLTLTAIGLKLKTLRRTIRAAAVDSDNDLEVDA